MKFTLGDMGVYDNYCTILSIFWSGIAVIWILMCGIAVSSSPAVTVHVCGFHPFANGIR